MIIFLGSFLAAFAYSFILLGSVNPLVENGVTIFLCLGTAVTFWKLSRVFVDARSGLRRLLYVVVGLHLGILLGYFLWDSPIDRLWVSDSISLHVPSAKAVVDLLLSRSSSTAVAADFHFAHYFVGIFFLLFGANPVASGIALLIPKLITIVLTFKLGARAFNERVGLVAAASYGLLPTILFYTLVFYKEAFVHCFAMGATYILFLINRREHTKGHVALLFGLLILIANERFYLFPLFVISTLWVFWSAIALSNLRRAAFLILLAGSAAVYVVQFSGKVDFSNFFSELTRFKNEYNSYPDVDRRWNADLLYPLGVIKLYFSPYFHPRKFDLFNEFSLLLIWGSFLNQIVLLFGVVQVFRQILADGFAKFTKLFGFLFVPFIGVMLVFGYVAPFAGRIRDTFVPLIAIFFAKIYVDFISRKNSKSHSV
jgi:hypothetical protein